MEIAESAAKAGNMNFFEGLDESSSKAMAGYSDEDGRSILHHAAAAGQAQVLSML